MVLDHKVRVFVFRHDGVQVDYLLLRRRPLVEHGFGPIRGIVGLDEHLEDAVIREVREETGLVRPTHLIDLEHVSRLFFGDDGLVEWGFAWQAPSGDLEIRPGPDIAESLWTGFDHAFETLELPEDRETLVRLRMMLESH
ncbi:MAG: NUDIX hydrolase [Planctomycetota bacterium]